MNEINEKIQVEEFTKKYRYIDVRELLGLLKLDINVFFSWGSHAYTVDNVQNPRFFRMKVDGRHHSGHVYIAVNGLDLFEVYLTTTRGKIVDKTQGEGIYFDDLVEWIDIRIEKVREQPQQKRDTQLIIESISLN